MVQPATELKLDIGEKSSLFSRKIEKLEIQGASP